MKLHKSLLFLMFCTPLAHKTLSINGDPKIQFPIYNKTQKAYIINVKSWYQEVVGGIPTTGTRHKEARDVIIPAGGKFSYSKNDGRYNGLEFIQVVDIDTKTQIARFSKDKNEHYHPTYAEITPNADGSGVNLKVETTKAPF